MSAILVVLSIALGSFALPFGILPSVFAFRGLADGRDASERTKRRYATVLWGGLLAAWSGGAAIVYAAGTWLVS